MINPSSQYLAAARSGATSAVLMTFSAYPRKFTTVPLGDGDPWKFPWISKMGAYKQSANDLDGSSSISNMAVTVLDLSNLITQDFPSVPGGFKGQKVTLQHGFVGLPLADWITFATLVVDTVSTDSDNTAYTFNLRDQSVLLQQQIYTVGDNPSYYTSSQNPATVGPSNPMDLVTAICAAVQPALTPNSAAIAAYKAGLLVGTNLEFSLTHSETAKDFLSTEILKPFGGYWFFNSLGEVTPYFWVPFQLPTVATSIAVSAIDQTNILQVPTADEADLLNQVDLTMEYNQNASFGAEDIEFQATSISLYNLVKSQTIDSRGQKLNFGAWGWVRLLANALFQRYAFFSPTYDVSTFMVPAQGGAAPQNLPPSCLELGDHLFLSGSGIKNRSTGVIGLTSRLCEVTSFSKDFGKKTVELGLLDKAWLQALSAYEVAPDGTPVYASATTTERATYAYIGSAASGTFSTGAANQVIY